MCRACWTIDAPRPRTSPADIQVPIIPGAVGAPGTGEADRQALPTLLGHTRARVLAALGHTATTGELARLLRVSPASASQHVHALAAADLVRSHRTGNRVLHSLAPLGTALHRGRLPGGKAPT
jgi:DNA-binding transcriptional ArsR family regulator